MQIVKKHWHTFTDNMQLM